MRFDGLFQRKEERETGSAVGPVVDANRAVMLVDNLRNDREPQSNAGLLGGHERIENLLAQFFGNTRPGIGEPHLDALAVISRCPRDLHAQGAAVFFHRFVGILHQIEKRLLAQTLVHRNRRQVACIVARHGNGLASPASATVFSTRSSRAVRSVGCSSA